MESFICMRTLTWKISNEFQAQMVYRRDNMDKLGASIAIAILFTFATQVYSRSVVTARDEGDSDGDYEESESEANKKALQNQVGVLDIIGGAFEGNLNKILKGSFSFSDKEIGEALIPQIVGADKAPAKKKPTASSSSSALTKGKEEDEAEN